MSAVYLVYRPVMDYEESMTPYFVCNSEQEANDADRVMCDFASKLAASLPIYTKEEEEKDEGCERWAEIEKQRRAILESVQWPFGVSLVDDLNGFYEITFNPSCVRVMELPLNPRQ